LGGCGAETKDRASQPEKFPLIASIHRSAWKKNSANFAFWGFSEVEPLLCAVLRRTPYSP
jgi:hypothetical protein